jgi:hypothetical protein
MKNGISGNVTYEIFINDVIMEEMEEKSFKKFKSKN